VLSGSQIVALCEASLVPGYVRKAQLVLTNEILTKFLSGSAPNLNSDLT